MKLSKVKLELTITDFCNLNCPLCSQGVPLQKDKKIISLEELKKMSKLVRPFEFEIIKISGGEPTLHLQFAEICQSLKKLFPAYGYYLSTNGFQLEKFINYLSVFNVIELTEYPGRNEELFQRLTALKIPNLVALRKRDYREIVDVYQEKNLGRKNLYQQCPYRENLKVVQDRIYACCNVFGQALRQNIPFNKVSVPFDENWRENLAKLNIEPYCQRCFANVPSFAEFLVYQARTKFARFLKRKFKPLNNYILQVHNLRQKIKRK